MEAPCSSGCVLCLLLHRPTSHLSFACRFSPGLCSAAALSPQPCCDRLLPGSRLLSMPLLPLLRRVLRQHAMLPVPSPTSDPLPTPTLLLLVPQACCDHLLTRGRLFCLPALPVFYAKFSANMPPTKQPCTATHRLSYLRIVLLFLHSGFSTFSVACCRPAVIISYLVAGFSACLPSLCYAEISASML